MSHAPLGLTTPLSRLPVRDYPMTKGGMLMPHHLTPKESIVTENTTLSNVVASLADEILIRRAVPTHTHPVKVRILAALFLANRAIGGFPSPSLTREELAAVIGSPLDTHPGAMVAAGTIQGDRHGYYLMPYDRETWTEDQAAMYEALVLCLPCLDEAPETKPEAAPAPAAPPIAEDQADERRSRRRRVASVEIPEEIHALATLTGQEPSAIIETIVRREVAALVIRALVIRAQAVLAHEV